MCVCVWGGGVNRSRAPWPKCQCASHSRLWTLESPEIITWLSGVFNKQTFNAWRWKTRNGRIGTVGLTMNNTKAIIRGRGLEFEPPELKLAIGNIKIWYSAGGIWMMDKGTWFKNKRRAKGVIRKLEVCGVWQRFEFRPKIQLEESDETGERN